MTPDALSRVEDCGSSSGGGPALSTATSITLTEEDAEQLAGVLGVPCGGCRRWRRTPLERGRMMLTASDVQNCLVVPKEVHPGEGMAHSCMILDTCGQATSRGSGGVVLSCLVHGRRSVTKKDTLGVVHRCLGVAPRPASDVLAVPEKPTGFDIVRKVIEAYATTRGLRKNMAMKKVFAPVPGCPCAYTPYKDFDDFITHVLHDHPAYQSSIRRHQEIEFYMSKYNQDAFPKLERDRSLLSFANGVLIIPENRFVPTPGGVAPPELEGRVARNHIPLEYTGGCETPLMDALVERQFGDSDGRRDLLYALIGRLLFNVKEKDNWQVVPLLIGQGGTGKSTVMNVVQGMFSDNSFGEIDGNNECTFGLQDKHDREVLFVRDAPQCMQKVLPQELFQKMVAGEGVQVSVKHGSAFPVVWKVPIIMASNHMLDYNDEAGQVSRRVVPFPFDNILSASEVDEDLDARIMTEELADVIARCLSLYLEMVASTKGRGGFWSFCPQAVRDARDDVMAQSSLLYDFLLAGSYQYETTRSVFRVREGSVTPFTEFKQVYDTYLRAEKMDRNPANRLTTVQRVPFSRQGYDLSHVNICKGCKAAPAHAGCCPDYSTRNRVRIWQILNMELVRSTVEGERTTQSEAERLFGGALEAAVGITFERNIRPEWVVNPVTGIPMELDFYCAQRKLAIEYDGYHHYTFPNRYHENREEFEAQQARDRAKDRICEERGVKLIRIQCLGLSRTADEVSECVARLVDAGVILQG
jgi:phage/plasmid-associated DNA primase